MTVLKLPGFGRMVMAGDMICGKWEWLSMLGVDGARAGIRMGSTEFVEGGGCYFGVAPNVEWMLLVVEVEATLAVNIMAPCWCRMWEMGGNLWDGGPLGGTIMGVDGTVGTSVVSESTLWGELPEIGSFLWVSKLWLILTVRELLENVVAAR